MPSHQFKMEYLKQIHDRYQKAAKQLKSHILDEFCRTARIHRKHAIRLLAGPKPQTGPYVPKPRRLAIRYSQEALSILAHIWEATNFLCSQRLKAALPLWLPWAKERFPLTPDLEKQLLAISPRQIDRRLAAQKRRLKSRLYGKTKPGSLLKQMIPVRTDFWDVKSPGFTEIDLVSHSGPVAAGDFLHTLNVTDIKTTWSEQRALPNKSQAAVVDGLALIERNFPFRLRGIDSDNGSEFINQHLWAFCRQRPRPTQIQFTRSREYKKDDNAHIEQKNGSLIRRLIGYDRYDSPQALKAMNALYADLRLFNNLFLPSMKLAKKIRKGSRLIRRYDTPRTPFQRVLECPQIDHIKGQEFQRILQASNPFDLARRIEQKLKALLALASKARPHKHPFFATPPRLYSHKLARRKGIQKKTNFRWLQQITKKGALAR